MDDKFPIDNEEQFFHNLFVEYYPSLCSFALRYVGDGEVVEDLVQKDRAGRNVRMHLKGRNLPSVRTKKVLRI